MVLTLSTRLETNMTHGTGPSKNKTYVGLTHAVVSVSPTSAQRCLHIDLLVHTHAHTRISAGASACMPIHMPIHVPAHISAHMSPRMSIHV